MLFFALHYPSTVLGVLLACFMAFQAIAVPSRTHERLLVLSLFGLLAGWAAAGTCKAMMATTMPRYDHYVYAIDRTFGSPSFALGALVVGHPFALGALRFAYDLLAVATTLVLLMREWTQKGVFFPVLAVVLNLILGLTIYVIFPVCGPIYAFPGFPALPSSVVLERVPIHAPPNGVPSVHLSTALLIVYFAWEWKLGRVLAIAYAVAMVLATLALGEHYLFDLIVAIPYSIGVVGIAKAAQRLRTGARAATHEDQGVVSV